MMIKIVFLTVLFIAFSGCHQKSTYISKFGQSIVLNPNQTQTKSGSTEIISNHKLTNTTFDGPVIVQSVFVDLQNT